MSPGEVLARPVGRGGPGDLEASAPGRPVGDPPPSVSVIVPVRNEAADVVETLHALLFGDYPASAMEVLVVDGESSDGTLSAVADIARSDARVRVLHNPRRTAPAGLNIGIRAARGEIVVRMDGHALPCPDYVSACVRALARTGAWCVGGRMVGVGDTVFGQAVALAVATPFGAGGARFRLGGEGPVDTVYLGAWPRRVFDVVGMFDEGLPRNQDYEHCIRVRRAGGIVWLDPRIRSVTRTRASPGALARQYFGYGSGRAATVVRHPASLRPRQALPAALVAGLALGLPAAVRVPEARRALALAAGAYAAADLVSSVAAARRAGPRHVAALSLVYATMHVSWGMGFWAGLPAAMAAERARREGAPRRSGGAAG